MGEPKNRPSNDPDISLSEDLLCNLSTSSFYRGCCLPKGIKLLEVWRSVEFLYSAGYSCLGVAYPVDQLVVVSFENCHSCRNQALSPTTVSATPNVVRECNGDFSPVIASQGRFRAELFAMAGLQHVLPLSPFSPSFAIIAVMARP